MKTFLMLAAAAVATPPVKPALAPSEIVAAAPAGDWVAIAPADLLVMDLANGKRVVIQLMPPPFSQGWIGNIRKLAAAKFWDDTSINRVQDNYVVQWGDATEKKALPEGLATLAEADYEATFDKRRINDPILHGYDLYPHINIFDRPKFTREFNIGTATAFADGWPIGLRRTGISPLIVVPASKKGEKPALRVDELAEVGFWELEKAKIWPTHCYGMVGVGRNLSPDTGTGAELYTVIGHAPRHLDRNIALVGRVIEGMEHLSSLPRGTGGLGFYESEAERTPITSVRIGADASDLPTFEYLNTESESFAAYADARANRRDPFFIKPAGGADICNIPVPVRRKKA